MGMAQLATIGTPERFIVSALRLWALPHCDPTREYPQWELGFQSSGLGLFGAAHFEALCRILAAAAPAGLQIHHLHCPNLGEDEAQLLHALWLLQQRQLAHAHTYLRGWLCPSAARAAIGPASAVALLLQAHRMPLTYRHAEGRMPRRGLPVESLMTADEQPSRLH